MPIAAPRRGLQGRPARPGYLGAGNPYPGLLRAPGIGNRGVATRLRRSTAASPGYEAETGAPVIQRRRGQRTIEFNGENPY
jgi:hypothetical protein